MQGLTLHADLSAVQDLMEILMPAYCTDVVSSEDQQQQQQPPQPTMSIDDANLPVSVVH